VTGLPAVQVAATVMLNLSMALVLGAGMSLAWLRGRSSKWAGSQATRLRRVMLASVTVALLAYAAVLWLEAAAMAEVPIMSAGSAVRTVLADTHFGFAWTIGVCALALALVSASIPRHGDRGRAADLVGLLAIGVFLYSRSIASHAGASGDLTWAVAADWLHLALISLWVGEVLVSGLVTLRPLSGAIDRDRLDTARYIEALSTSATVALVGIFVTGMVNAWRGLGSVENAIGNEYATVLLVKLAFVTGAATLGGVNRFFVMPDLLADLCKGGVAADALQRRFVLVLQVEAILLLAALVMAAILSSTPPPAAG
jgi:putative copper resistance protein D